MYPILSILIAGFVGFLLTGFSYSIGYFLWGKFQVLWYEADPILLTIIPLFAGIGLAAITKHFVRKDTILGFVMGSVLLGFFEVYQRL